MNRIASLAMLSGSAATDSQPVPVDRDERRAQTPHSLFIPLHYEPKYAYPLIVWLHGPGESETALRKTVPMISTRNYAAVAPRGTMSVSGEPFESEGFAWSEAEGHSHLAEQRIFESMDIATERLNVAPDRVFIGGIGAGGTTAFRIALKYPDIFAGVASMNGVFPTGRSPLLRLSDARGLPMFIACGRNSTIYPDQQVCDDLRLLHSAGMQVSLRLYPSQDEVVPQMFSDLDRWIMELVTAAPEAEVSRPQLGDDS